MSGEDCHRRSVDRGWLSERLSSDIESGGEEEMWNGERNDGEQGREDRRDGEVAMRVSQREPRATRAVETVGPPSKLWLRLRIRDGTCIDPVTAETFLTGLSAFMAIASTTSSPSESQVVAPPGPSTFPPLHSSGSSSRCKACRYMSVEDATAVARLMLPQLASWWRLPARLRLGGAWTWWGGAPTDPDLVYAILVPTRWLMCASCPALLRKLGGEWV